MLQTWNCITQVAIAFSRPREAGRFGEDERAYLAKLLPHVRRAARIAQKLSAPGGFGHASLKGGLTSARMASYLVDSNGTVRWMNAAGENLLSCSNILTVKDGRLTVRHREKDRDLVRLIASAVDKRLATTPARLLRVPGDGDTLEIEVLPATVPAGALIETTALAIVMARPIGLTPAVIGLLKQQYRLTEAEGRLALALADGASIEQAAKAGGVSLHTVRTQLRSIFAKTGVKRQSALAALIWKSA
ncbi:MAG: helix-turn-helix transcriptional regulator [Alphaproteobacteria bacterium]|nr:helix-turn-helix transcriptional regulator [Alphaproteobacteria bacterium]